MFSPASVFPAPGTPVIKQIAFRFSHALHGIENADGGVVVHGKEGIRILVAVEHIRSDDLCILTIVTIACQSLVKR